jgi:hypothetical protein
MQLLSNDLAQPFVHQAFSKAQKLARLLNVDYSDFVTT